MSIFIILITRFGMTKCVHSITLKMVKEGNHILVMQNVHTKLETRKYFQLGTKEFHSSNPKLCL